MLWRELVAVLSFTHTRYKGGAEKGIKEMETLTIELTANQIGLLITLVGKEMNVTDGLKFVALDELKDILRNA